MKPLKNALSSWAPIAASCDDPVLQIKAVWRDIVGDEVAANSRPEQLVRGALLVVTRSNAWCQQLAFLSERILRALSEHTGVQAERVRFRVGRLNEQAVPRRPARGTRVRRAVEARQPAQTAQEALMRFRTDVAAAERAKAAAGWKECCRCGVRIHPASGPFCVPCENARTQERDAAVARLMYEAPWLGYAGIAPLVEDLTPRDYEAIRLRLLRRWHDALQRVRRTGNATTGDRLIASSYVLLKSELDPERIAPSVVRDLLGDELHNIFYGNENRKTHYMKTIQGMNAEAHAGRERL